MLLTLNLRNSYLCLNHHCLKKDHLLENDLFYYFKIKARLLCFPHSTHHFACFMIYYTTTKTDCLISIMQSVANGRAKFWFSDYVPMTKLSAVLPKLIVKYALDLPESERKKKSDRGDPLWSMVVNYNPAEPDQFQFWLFTTGFREARRSKLKLKEIEALNSSMVQKQKLTSILTVKKEKLLRFGPYVLGQYIEFSDLKPEFSQTYYFPDIDGVIFNTQAKRLKTIDSNKKSVYRLFKPFDDSEQRRFTSLHRNFAFAFLDNEHTHWNNASVTQFLLGFGIKFNEDVSYNDKLKELTRILRGVRKKHLEFFQRHSQKKVRFTWYLSTSFMDGVRSEFERKLRMIIFGQDNHRLAEASRRLMAHSNFHGTRHQIGSVQARVRQILNDHQPEQKKLNQKYFTKTLHYVRFTKKKALSIKEFELACRNADTIYSNKAVVLEKKKRPRRRKKAVS